MAAPTSDVHICNLALDRLGQGEISSIATPQNKTEDICARHYDSTRRELLRRYIFNFAKKLTTLSVDALKTPAFGFSSAYTLPNDFLRLMALGDITLDRDMDPRLFDLNEGFIYTDSGEGGALNMQYVFDAKQVNLYDPLFVRLFTLHLASNMAYKFTLKNSLITAIRKDADDVALTAAAVAGQEKPPRRVQRSKLRNVRRFGDIYRDNRFV